ncbi:hypothetical protein QOT17_000108 [Balamuthia mandrillaris]
MASVQHLNLHFVIDHCSICRPMKSFPLTKRNYFSEPSASFGFQLSFLLANSFLGSVVMAVMMPYSRELFRRTMKGIRSLYLDIME